MIKLTSQNGNVRFSLYMGLATIFAICVFLSADWIMTEVSKNGAIVSEQEVRSRFAIRVILIPLVYLLFSLFWLSDWLNFRDANKPKVIVKYSPQVAEKYEYFRLGEAIKNHFKCSTVSFTKDGDSNVMVARENWSMLQRMRTFVGGWEMGLDAKAKYQDELTA